MNESTRVREWESQHESDCECENEMITGTRIVWLCRRKEYVRVRVRRIRWEVSDRARTRTLEMSGSEKWFRKSMERGRDKFNLTNTTSFFQKKIDVNMSLLTSVFEKINVNMSLLTSIFLTNLRYLRICHYIFVNISFLKNLY